MKDEGWSKELEGKQLEEEINVAISAARAWMEIVPENSEDKGYDTLQVGETALLSVKSTLPGKAHLRNIFKYLPTCKYLATCKFLIIGTSMSN